MMAFRDAILGRPRPSSVRGIDLPRREQFFPSPADWRDEVIYFLLSDRFSDGQEDSRVQPNRRSDSRVIGDALDELEELRRVLGRDGQTRLAPGEAVAAARAHGRLKSRAVRTCSDATVGKHRTTNQNDGRYCRRRAK